MKINLSYGSLILIGVCVGIKIGVATPNVAKYPPPFNKNSRSISLSTLRRGYGWASAGWGWIAPLRTVGTKALARLLFTSAPAVPQAARVAAGATAALAGATGVLAGATGIVAGAAGLGVTGLNIVREIHNIGWKARENERHHHHHAHAHHSHGWGLGNHHHDHHGWYSTPQNTYVNPATGENVLLNKAESSHLSEQNSDFQILNPEFFQQRNQDLGGSSTTGQISSAIPSMLNGLASIITAKTLDVIEKQNEDPVGQVAAIQVLQSSSLP